MPDGQGVWHYDDEVNICNTYIWLFLLLYIFLYILYLWSCTCHLNLVSLLLLCCCCCCFLSLSLVYVACCLWYCSAGFFDFLVLLLCCELVQSGVVGSGWSFYFIPVLAWCIVLTFLFFYLFCVSCFSFTHLLYKHLFQCMYFFMELMFTSSILQGKSPRAKYSFYIFL